MTDRVSTFIAGHDLREVAQAVKQISDQYNADEGSLTPWSDPELARAYVAYFMTLNFARLNHVWREVERFDLKPTEIWDIGSGPGTLQWVLEDRGWQTTLHNVESSSEARKWHQSLRLSTDRIATQWQTSITPQTGALGVFSYSLLELPSEALLSKFDHLLILEPSTHTRGRNLMELRQRLIEKQFIVWAPCTHQLRCPLLINSDRDWCHMRCDWEKPTFWSDLEQHLPMKNGTLTYSYLLASRLTPPSKKFAARIIGDTLPERGKIRQMICRGEAREFLSWLTRNGEPARIPHGALLPEMPLFETKSSELRVQDPIDWID